MKIHAIKTASKALILAIAVTSFMLTPFMSQPAYAAADCFGDENSHPDCFNVYVDKVDRQDSYFGVASYSGSLTAFNMKIVLIDEDGDWLDVKSKACTGSCYIGTDSFSGGSNDSLCASLTVNLGSVTIYSDSDCRVI